ncbi:hypothetical protein RFI_02947, partial [Reticulomyxa filosa]
FFFFEKDKKIILYISQSNYLQNYYDIKIMYTNIVFFFRLRFLFCVSILLECDMLFFLDKTKKNRDLTEAETVVKEKKALKGMATDQSSSKKQDVPKDELHQSLRALLEQVRGQLAVLTKENSAKDKQIEKKENEINVLQVCHLKKKRISVLQLCILVICVNRHFGCSFEQLSDSKIGSERSLRAELNELRKEYDIQSKNNNAIQAKLL